MKYILTAHAEFRMKERGISSSLLEDALRHPTAIAKDPKGNILLKKTYRKHGQLRLLLIVCRMKGDIALVITIIDTSKVRKYL